MWRWKRLLRDGLFIVLAGLLIGTAAAFFEIEASTVQIFIIVCCGIYLLLTILYYFVLMQPYRRRVLQQNADMEAGRTDKALTDMEAMMHEPRVQKSRYLTQCCQINLSAAYCRLEQYERALEILKAMPEKKLKEQALLVYHLNTCICIFYMKNEQEGLSYYHAHQKLFHAYRNNRHYGGNLAILKCWALAAQGKISAAREVLTKTKQLWNTPSLLEAYEKLDQRLVES